MPRLGESREKVFLPLTGGLGNQIFQIAAAISKYPSSDIYLEIEMGKPRLNVAGNIEISDYKLDPKFHFTKPRRAVSLESKLFGFNIRSSKHPKGFERSKLFQLLIRGTSSAILSIAYRIMMQILTEYNFDSKNRIALFKNTLLIGYFQKYKWVFDSRERLCRILELRNETLEFQNIAKAAAEKILVVHLRRGDYRNEPTFGLVGSKYYENALKFFESKKDISAIWVFSDDPEEAMRILEKQISNKTIIKLIPTSTLSSAETLELMRLGTYYIISNSTFSWWGAFLSKNNSAVIVAPYPWFKTTHHDKSIYAPHWYLMDSEFE